MDNLEKARELFRRLEDSGIGQAADIARRNFCIQDILAVN